MAYIDWWNRTGPATLGERFGLKAKGPTKEGLKDLELVNKVLQENNIKPEKPRFQYEPKKLKGYYYNKLTEELEPRNNPSPHISSTEPKQMEDIKKSSRKVSVKPKPPELTGVDRYIRAKKI